PAAVTASALASGEGMPLTFLKTILSELRGADLIVSQRGPDRGYRLTRPPGEITVGEVIRVVDGSITDVRDATYDGAAAHLGQIWLAADTVLLSIVDGVTLADIVAGHFPA